jgi:hypothetical protein
MEESKRQDIRLRGVKAPLYIKLEQIAEKTGDKIPDLIKHNLIKIIQVYDPTFVVK